MAENSVLVARKAEIDNAESFLALLVQAYGPDVGGQLSMACTFANADFNVNVPSYSKAHEQKAVREFLDLLRSYPGIVAHRFEASPHEQLPHVRWEEQDQLSAIVKITPRSGHEPFDRLKALMTATCSRFDVVGPKALRMRSLTQAETDALRIYEIATQKLQSAVGRLGEQLADQTREFSHAMLQREQAIEKRAAASRSELDAEAAAAREKLKAERDDFEKFRAEFDDAGRTHKRRSLMDRLVNRLEKQGEKPITSLFRGGSLVVHIVCWLILGGSGYVLGAAFLTTVGLAAKDATQATQADWLLIARMASMTIVFATTLYFYLRWLATRVEQEVVIRRNQDKVVADSIRAEWLAELVFEAKEDRDETLPPALLTSYTRGLFRDVAASPQEHHALDALGRAGRFRAKAHNDKTGIEVEAGGKERRK